MAPRCTGMTISAISDTIGVHGMRKSTPLPHSRFYLQAAVNGWRNRVFEPDEISAGRYFHKQRASERHTRGPRMRDGSRPTLIGSPLIAFISSAAPRGRSIVGVHLRSRISSFRNETRNALSPPRDGDGDIFKKSGFLDPPLALLRQYR